MRILLLAIMVFVAGCRYEKAPAPQAYRPQAQRPQPVRPQPAQVTQSPQPAPAYVPPTVPPPSEPRPVPPPDTSWVETLTRTAPAGVSVSYTPTVTDEEGSARVRWTSPNAVAGYFVGLDADGAVVAVDYRAKGKQSGALDVFRRELVRVARWDVAELR